MKIFSGIITSKRNGGDDAIFTAHLSDGTLLAALADGATGSGDGKTASSLFIEMSKNITSFDCSDEELQRVFIAADQQISNLPFQCDTTGIVFLVNNNKYILLSVGDSSVWMIDDTAHTNLTTAQIRKPRVGTGCSIPKVLRGNITGAVIIASDGLEYAMPLEEAIKTLDDADPATSICNKAKQRHPDRLPDDLSVIIILPDY